jgi:hypothetical protein
MAGGLNQSALTHPPMLAGKPCMGC